MSKAVRYDYRVSLSVSILAHNKPGPLRKLLNSKAINNFDIVNIFIDPVPDESGKWIATSMIENICLEAKKANARIKIHKHDSHLGLYRAVRKALDITFELSDFATIFEEDCIPSPLVIDYIKTLISNPKIELEDCHVALSRHVPSARKLNISHSKYPFVWGWASSKKVWSNSKVEAKEYDLSVLQTKLWSVPGATKEFVDHWLHIANLAKSSGPGKIENNWIKNSWATPFTIGYWLKNKNQYSLRPPINLVKNIGFGTNATHTFRKPAHAKRVPFFPRSLPDLNYLQIDEFNLLENKLVYDIRGAI